MKDIFKKKISPSDFDDFFIIVVIIPNIRLVNINFKLFRKSKYFNNILRIFTARSDEEKKQIIEMGDILYK